MLRQGTIIFFPHETFCLSKNNRNDWLPDNNSIETGVWLVNNPLSNVFKEEIMHHVNQLPFIGSSKDVGANTKTKSRYYRVSTKSTSGGLFQLSSDQCLLERSPMQDVEKKLVDLVSNLMEEQDQIIAAANPGKKMCRWVHVSTNGGNH